MSDAMMADFNRITDSFSGEELVSAISILTEKLKKLFAGTEEKPKVSKEEEALQNLLALSETLNLRSDGTKWTREEMYER